MKGEVVVYGVHAAEALLASHPEEVRSVALLQEPADPRRTGLAARARAAGIAVQGVGRERLDALCDGAAHQGVVLHCRRLPQLDERSLLGELDGLDTPPLLLVLDGVQDPHNLGACLRSAAAAGAHAVIVPRDAACGLTATVVKVASGAVGSVAFARVANLARCLRALGERGVWIVGTAHDAPRSLYRARLEGALALVMGAEERGLRRLTREHCDELVRIPLHGAVASLNVSVAAGVCLFEAQRRRAPAAD